MSEVLVSGKETHRFQWICPQYNVVTVSQKPHLGPVQTLSTPQNNQENATQMIWQGDLLLQIQPTLCGSDDMLEKGVDVAMTANRGEWKKMMCADPK